jgi:hypothetical protein
MCYKRTNIGKIKKAYGYSGIDECKEFGSYILFANVSAAFSESTKFED